ncbi:MAG TPA: hypothetical protein VHC43_11865 [Mycobacteriales bacterium]|nr:hypothetical protein [Mycobacteriales bacterium]
MSIRFASAVAVLAGITACTAAVPPSQAPRHAGASDKLSRQPAAELVDADRASLAKVQWPTDGQAAVVVGHARPVASADQEPVPIASVAKVMTAYLTLEAYPLRDADDGFTATVSPDEVQMESEEAALGQSVVAVQAGERLTEREMLEALLIPSGNNIARILATRVAGSESLFIARMNDAAHELGMNHTTYTDPSGWDPATTSTAADQLQLFRHAMRFAVFRQIVKMPYAALPVAGTVRNTNPILADGFFGKTGSESAAGACLAFFTHAVLKGHRQTAVGVVLGQWEPNSSSVVLAAAGRAAEDLVGSLTAQRPTYRPLIQMPIRADNRPAP